MTLAVSRPLKGHAYYLNHAFKADTTGLVADAKRALTGIDFDTIVCTGLSGMLVAPVLWRALEVPYLAVVRKPQDTDNHSSHRVEGVIGARWIFVDDLVSSGLTRSRVHDAVSVWARSEEHNTEFVGTYSYRYTVFLGPNSTEGSE